MTEIFIGEKENGQIKGLISNMWLFLLHNITHHYKALYQNPESLLKQLLRIFDRKKYPYLLYKSDGRKKMKN